MIVSNDSSPYENTASSPTKDSSPRAFWTGRDPMSPSRYDSENTPEQREPSPGPFSPKRRASIEKLKQAGRVKTSNIFALESRDQYDVNNTPVVERPAANRPMSQNLLNNSFTRFDSLRKENTPLRSPQSQRGHKRTESETALHITSPSHIKHDAPPSPTKSALAHRSQFESPHEQDSTPWSDGDDRAPTPRALHRHHKSVTFHEKPEVNEYEHPTPEPSLSATSESREGSWDSEEYYDPDYSFERGSSADQHRDDSFDEDLENADKTPVVLPEDWSRMSPEAARRDLIDDGDDVFEGSPEPERPVLGRSESVASDGESRPLPPLPGFMRDRQSLNAAAERASMAARTLPSPPKRASISHYNEDRPTSKQGEVEELTITNLDTGESRDVNMNENEAEDDSVVADLADFANSPPKISRESILRKVRKSKYEFEPEDEDASENDDDSPARPTYAELAKMHPDDPIPSRENSRETSDDYNNAYARERGRLREEEVEIKEEPVEESGIDLSTIPAIGEAPAVASTEDYQRESSVLRHDVSSPSDDEDETESKYSSVEPDAESTEVDVEPTKFVEPEEADEGKESLQDAMQLLTVKDYSVPEPAPTPAATEKPEQTSAPATRDFMGLPTYLSTGGFEGMEEYFTPTPPASNDNTKQLDIVKDASVLAPAAELKPTYKDLPRPTYDGAEFSPEGTPESVVRQSSSEFEPLDEEPVSEVEIPERRATIRTGGLLKARPSATPADMRMMAEQRRLVSAEHPVPPIPQAYQAEMEETTELSEDLEATTYSSEGNESKADSAVEPSPESKAQEKESRKMNINLDIPAFDGDSNGNILGLDQEFERVIEQQKVRYNNISYAAEGRARTAGFAPDYPAPFSSRSNNSSVRTNMSSPTKKGYLMRQNTKLVVASNRNFSNDSNDTNKSNESGPMSPTSSRPSSRSGKGVSRKGSAEQFLKTEPWNGTARRKSQRQASIQQHSNGTAPPLPGQPSALGVVNEDFAAGTSSMEDDVGEGVERGRLFVKVVGVKDLDLPMPKNDRLYFQLTLDNGLHCVTTSSLELGKAAAIGQEFELVVLNDLEFQLTLTTKLPAPPAVRTPTTPSSPSKIKHQKSSSLSRFLTSPKKRAERDRQEREAVEAEERRQNEEARRKRASVQPTSWDLLHDLVNPSDGSFARAYINLKAHEKHCFGRQLTVDVPCYNEWALESDSAVVNSVRSKRGNVGPIRRPPYVVGQLELQLLYVPRPANAADEDMPKSMGSAIREMSRAVEVVDVAHEGHLSQQGGDCVHWRRRFFRLQGARLTAYHEHTQQKRAVINLSKATRLVDDKSTLVADPKSGNPSSRGGRRKSAFAEEDEGYAYVEEGFRIRFANGETIDFYADSTAAKDQWMAALSQVIGKPDVQKKNSTWTDLVIKREKAEPKKVEGEENGVEVRDFTKPPALPRKNSERKPVNPARPATSHGGLRSPAKKDVPERPRTPPMNPRRAGKERDQVKSMIF